MSEFEMNNKSDTSITNDIVIFKLNDGKSFNINKKFALYFKVIKTFLEENDDNSDNVNEFPLLNVDYDIFKKTIEFIEYYHVHNMNEIPKPVNSKFINEIVGDWYGNFIESFNNEDIKKLIHVSDYLMLDPLLNLCCASIACNIRQKPSNEIIEILKK